MRYAYMAAMAAFSLLFQGCDLLNFPSRNSVTIVNDLPATGPCLEESSRNITHFGLSKAVGGTGIPANILVSALAPGQEFTVNGLPDGDYVIFWGSGCRPNNTIRQYIERGERLKFYAR